MMQNKVLFTGCTFDKNKRQMLLEKYGMEIVSASRYLSEKELIENLKDCDSVIVNGEEKYTSNVLSACPKLKIIQFFGIGYEKCVDKEVAKKYGKIVANTPKVNSYSVAEFTLGLIFALNQKLLQHHENTKKGIWEEKTFFDLQNKTIGIVGLGHIGIPFAKLMCQAFHTKILYYDLEEKKEMEKSYNMQRTSLEELFTLSDIVSIHLPLNASTKGLIGENYLSLMPKHAYLINTARAEIVDATSLYHLLKEDKIAGCAFDGFYEEPVSFDSIEANLLSLPTGKFLLTPHTGYNAVEGEKRVEEMCIENLEKIFNGEVCQGIVTQ